MLYNLQTFLYLFKSSHSIAFTTVLRQLVLFLYERINVSFLIFLCSLPIHLKIRILHKFSFYMPAAAFEILSHAQSSKTFLVIISKLTVMLPFLTAIFRTHHCHLFIFFKKSGTWLLHFNSLQTLSLITAAKRAAHLKPHGLSSLTFSSSMVFTLHQFSTHVHV